MRFKTNAFLCSLLLLATVLAGCDSKTKTAPSVPASSPSPAPVAISLKQVIEAFEMAKLPMKDTVVYDEKTDPNGLLGRPNGYLEKMNFTDTRDKKSGKQSCSIEIFKSDADAQARKDYVDRIGRAASTLATYSYIHRNVLVRISYGVLPADAEAYRLALESVGN